MATKFTPKKKKITGTKRADKITWVNKKGWRNVLTVNAGNGNDTISFQKSKYKNKLNGGSGNDKIYGGTNIDTIHGNTGNDIIYGYNGNDKLYGDAGKDKLYGGNGNDKIYGGKGNDTINAGKGTNTIYYAKGDGTDTILNGGGVDTIIFNGVKNLNNIKASVSGKNVQLKISKGNTVILKNYMSTNHSTQYVKVGTKKVKVETLLPVKNISSTEKTVTGTNLRDKITSNTDNAVINSFAGDDTINICGADFKANPGKGNDVINIISDHEVIPDFDPPRMGFLTINKGDGNDTINGIGNLIANKIEDLYALTINGNGLVQNFHGLYYVEGSISGNNMILKSADGGTLTITDFMSLNPKQRNNALGFIIPGFASGPAPIDYLYRSGGENINIVQNKNISITKDFTFAATVDRGLHTVNIQSQLSKVLFNGGNNNVAISGFYNQLTFNSGTSNNVNITGEYISCDFESGTVNNVTVNSTESNNISFYGNNNEITTSGGGQVGIWLWSEDISRANILNAGSYDYISNFGYADITFSGNYRKVVEVTSAVAKAEIRGISEAQEVEIDYCDEGNASDLVFTHYYNVSANSETNGEDYITLLAKDESGNFMNTETKLWGNWTDGTFDLEHFSIDKLKIQYNDDGNTITQIGLNEQKLTQYVDLSNPSIHENGPQTGKIYNLGAGVLSMAKDVYVQGLDTNETYNTDIKWDKKYVLNDTAGTDELVFSDENDYFRCFFDVDTEGQVGRDLYFVSIDNDGDNDFESFITDNDSDVGSLCIKNGINAEGDNLGSIETIKAGQGEFDLNFFIESVVDDVAAWLSACNSANQNKYGTVMDAIQDGKGGTEYAGKNLYAIYSEGNSNWGNYWV